MRTSQRSLPCHRALMVPRAPMGRGATAFSARRARPAAGRRSSPAVREGSFRNRPRPPRTNCCQVHPLKSTVGTWSPPVVDTFERRGPRPIGELKAIGRVCLLILLQAVLPAPSLAARLPLRRYTTNDGLPHNRVNQIMRDSHGFLWFCTPNGLGQFDGTAFVTHGADQALSRGILE